MSAHPGHGGVVGRVDLLEAQVTPRLGLASLANAFGALIRRRRLLGGGGGRCWVALAEPLPDPSGAAAKSDHEGQPRQDGEEDDRRPTHGRFGPAPVVCSGH